MEEEFKKLAEEICRIVSSPYAVSLKALRDLLRNIVPDTLRQWAFCNACQIDSLAAAIIQGIRTEPYTLEIVRSLSNVASIRDAFFRQEPLLLSSILSQATSSSSGDLRQSMATSTCVSMLSTTLPDTLPVPVEVSSFTQVLLDEAVEKASADTLRPLYQVLKGVGPAVLEIFPPQKLLNLQNELIKLLRSLEDHSANLLCLAIFATLHTGIQRPCPSTGGTAQSFVSSQESESSKIPAAVVQMQDNVESARQFFRAKKASKTLDLVVLRAIQSCSTAPETHPARVIESFRLCKEILDAVDPAEKADWAQKKSTMVRKLYEKARRTDVDIGLPSRLALFEVVGSLVTIQEIPNDLISVIEKLLHRSVISEGVGGIANAYISRFSEEFILAQFTKALGSATALDYNQPEVSAVSEIATLQILIDCITEAAQKSSSVRQTILVAVSSNKLRDIFQRFLNSKPLAGNPDVAHGRQLLCNIRVQALRCRLQRQICHLLLRSAFYASSVEVALDPSFATSLLEKATTASLPLGSCEAYKPDPKLRLPFLSATEINTTTIASRTGKDWRLVLKEELDRDAAHSHELMIRQVEHVCRDLEARCNEVEQPLKEERERSRSLQSELDNYKERCSEIEAARKGQDLVIDGIKAERSQISAEKEKTQQAAEDIAEALNGVYAQLRQSNEAAAKAARAAKDNLHSLELGHLAAMVAKDELLEEETERAATLENKVKVLEEELSKSQEEREMLRVRLESASNDARSYEAKIEDLQQTISRGRSDLDEQTNVTTRLGVELRSVTEELANLKSEFINTKLLHEREIEGWNAKASKSLKDLEMDLRTVQADELARLQSEFKDEVGAIENKYSELREEKARLVTDYEGKMAGLTHKIEKLNRERDIRDREFAEAQDLSSRLMAIMGHRNSNSSIPITKSTSSQGPSVKDFGLTIETEKVNTDVSQQHNSDSNSSSASGSTPKRPRPRYSHKISNSNQLNPPYQKPAMSMRKPLQDIGPNISANRSPTRRQSTATQLGEQYKFPQGAYEKHVKESSPSDIEDASFGPGSIVTSTDFRNMDDESDVNALDAYEGTTTD